MTTHKIKKYQHKHSLNGHKKKMINRKKDKSMWKEPQKILNKKKTMKRKILLRWTRKKNSTIHFVLSKKKKKNKILTNFSSFHSLKKMCVLFRMVTCQMKILNLSILLRLFIFFTFNFQIKIQNLWFGISLCIPIYIL